MKTVLLILVLSFFMYDLSAQQDLSIKKAQELSWQGNYKESISEYDKVLAKDPKNLAALEGKADVLSWMGDFDGSIKAYDELLEQKFISNASRKKARVLAWGQRFNDSMDAYKASYQDSDDEATKHEMFGKKSWWDGRTAGAIAHYKEVLNLEPDNIEVRSDLAQVEAQSRLVDEAAGDFGYITQKYPWHFRAREGLDKLNTVYKRPYVIPSVSWFDGLSIDRYTEIRRLYSELMFGIPFLNNYDLLMGYALDNFNYKESSSIIRHYAMFGLNMNFGSKFWFNGLYGTTAYTSNDIPAQKYKFRMGTNLFEPVVLAVFAQMEGLNNNKMVLENKIQSTDVGVNVKINVNRYFIPSLEYKRSFLNDTNRTNWLSLEQIVVFSPAPYEFTFTGRFQYQDWKTVTNKYFSPQHFFSVPVTLRWRHYLNKDGLYYGARDTYYGFRYQFQVDRGKIIFNGLGVELHHDFSNKFGLHYDIFGNYSNVYKDFGMSLGLVGYF